MRGKVSFKTYCLENGLNDLLEEWSYEDNSIQPDEVSTGSCHIKPIWICKRGHKWAAPVTNRLKGHGCPYCAHHWPIPGETDLETTNPELASEWNYEKNGDLLPSMVFAGSNRKVWWRCSKGHEWEAWINNRSKGRGCPICSKARATSIPEKAIFFYARQLFPDCQANYIIPKSHEREIDVFIPSLNIGIEYDGLAWHQNPQKDEKKDAICKELGIFLIRIREKGCPSLSGNSLTISCPPPVNDLSNFRGTLVALLRELERHARVHSEVDVDPTRDYSKIIELMGYVELENSLAKRFPEIAAEWNYQKNGSVTPEMVNAGSRKKVWWICARGHEWQAQISNRTNDSNRTSCPYCGNKKVLAGFNDLATTHPVTAAEWDYEKNAPLLPTQFTARAGKKVWWLCPRGHSWKATIASRKTSGCPVCANKKTVTGLNDFESKYPELAKMWDFEKNPLGPDKVNFNSTKKVFWICPTCHCGFGKSPYSLAHGHGCPVCAHQLVVAGFNDLATTHPNIAAEWDYEKNYPITPQQVSRGTEKKYWWIDSTGYSYQASVISRTSSKRQKRSDTVHLQTGKVRPGYNDLASQNPKLASQWNYEKNGDLLPTQVTASSGRMVWWICQHGHEWQATVSNRNSKSNHTGCPICSGAKTVKGINDLATLYPDLMLDWDFGKNIVDPTTVSPGSNKKAFWKCHYCGREWEAQIASRAHGGYGCASCGHKCSHKKK